MPPEGRKRVVTKSGENDFKNGSDQTDGNKRESNKCMTIFPEEMCKPSAVIERRNRV